MNQVTPYGNLTYTVGETVNGIPQYTATQTLTKDGQELFDYSMGAQKNIGKLMEEQSGRLSSLLNRDLDFSQLPQAGQAPQYSRYGAGPQLTLRGGDTSGILTQSGASAGGIMRDSGASAGGIMRDSGASTGGIMRDSGASVGGIMRDSGASHGGVQMNLGTNDFSKDRQRVESAMFSRLDPQIARQREAMETELVNRGIRPGSAAHSAAMRDFNQSLNDQRTSILLGAGQEQSRLQDMALNAGNFANAAQDQRFGQKFANAQFNNAAQQQRYDQLMGNAQFNNQAQQQRFGQSFANAQFNNQAQQQRYDQLMGNAQFNNAAQQQRYDQLMGNANFTNAAQQQLYNQQMGNAAFGNAGRQQMYANQIGAKQANNALLDQGFNNQNIMRQNALNEMMLQRNTPLNELLALSGQGQLQQPNFIGTPQTGVAGTDIAGIQNANYAQQMQGYNANQQLLGGLFSAGASLLPGLLSDRRAKKDIERIGQTEAGTPLYKFRYKHGGPVQIGVMAQDLLETQPDAVVMGPDGFYRVDYGKVA